MKGTSAVLGAGALTGALMFVGAGMAAAGPFDISEGYCSPSMGCVGKEGGQNVYAQNAPQLTPEEENLRLQCDFALAAAGAGFFGGAAGVISGSFAGLAAANGPCQALYESTARYH